MRLKTWHAFPRAQGFPLDETFSLFYFFFSRPITRTVKIKIVTGNNPKKVSTEDQDKLGVCEWNELTKRLSSIFSSRFCISMESIKTWQKFLLKQKRIDLCAVYLNASWECIRFFKEKKKEHSLTTD